MAEQQAIEILESLTQEALMHKPLPSYGQIGTIKAMADLGSDWHDHKAIQRELCKYHKTGNSYVYKLLRVCPQLIEKDEHDRVRIRPEVYPVVSMNIGKYAAQIQEAIKQNK